jgi:apolipoprotein N-acyltransferase
MDEKKKPPSRAAFIPRIKTYSPVESEAWQVMASFAPDPNRAMRVSPGFTGRDEPTSQRRVAMVAALMLTKSMPTANLSSADASARIGEVRNDGMSQPGASALGMTRKALLLHALAAAGAFHLAWSFPSASAFIVVYAWGLLKLSEANSTAQSFRFGFLGGFLVFAPQLTWFWAIFGPAAICLWAVLSFFTALFVALLHLARVRFGTRFFWIIAPVFWTGIEFFRSELYPLKFAWFSVGYVFSGKGGLMPIGLLGVYGVGFLVFLIAALCVNKTPLFKAGVLMTLLICANWPAKSGAEGGRELVVAGVQLEFPPDLEVPKHLDRVLARYPAAQIVVLSEYVFDGSVPKHVGEWCRRNQRYLIAGGKEDVFEDGRSDYRNTAFVVGPGGEIVFQQCKSVPIQFFKDGLPAREQRVWESPFGKIAIPTCYDLSYRRVTDQFAAGGPEAFIVPFMDVAEWGERQHRQHARIAPIRAREYGVPIFRLGSSGISQHVDARGRVLANSGFPGQEEVFGATLKLNGKARLPLDHWLAPLCSGFVGCGVVAFFGIFLRECSRGKSRRA